VARRFRLPLLAGYLVAGVLMGPSALGLVSDAETIVTIAELGVALLMFALGVELSLRDLAKMKPAALIAAPLQIILSVGLGLGVGLSFGWSMVQGLVLGFVLALSSTMVVVKLLAERGELHTQQGKVMVAILLVQDLAAVVMVGLLPALSGLGGYSQLLVTLGKGALFVICTVIMARFIAPWLMAQVARGYSKEIFVAVTALLCFGGAASSYLLGFSMAIGAFVAGLVLSESIYSHEVLANVTPLRDLFGMVFFVSLGLLFDVSQVLEHPLWTLVLLLAIVLGKALIVAVSCFLAGYHMRTALISGLGLGQIGEFSFLVAVIALQDGNITQPVHSLIVGSAVVSILASPALMSLGGILYSRVRRWPAGDAAMLKEELVRDRGRAPKLSNHVILCGFGRVGSHIGEMLHEENVPFVVIEYDHHVVNLLRQKQLPVIYGDSTSHLLLEAAGAGQARLAVVALPEGISTRLTIRELRRLNPTLRIITRVHLNEELEPACSEGAAEVIHVEFEASLELMRHTLIELGRHPSGVQKRIDRIRQSRYQKLREEE
jgi:CPA2 family monovalent cation:H+ antiporter-2